MSFTFAPASFKLVRGTGWKDRFTLVDKDSGDPVNLSGIVRIIMRVRAYINGPVLAELSTIGSPARITIVNALTGVVEINCNSAFTLTFPANENIKATYVYDSLIERTAGEYEPATGGKVIVLPQITRPLE